MVGLAQVGGTEGVEATLTALGLSQPVVSMILKSLTTGSSALQMGSENFASLDDSMFGAGSSGKELGVNTRLAHERLSNAILEAVAGLQQTEQAVADFRADVGSTEDEVDQRNLELLARARAAGLTMDDDSSTPADGPDTGGNQP